MEFEGNNANESWPLSDKERANLKKALEGYFEQILVAMRIDIRNDPNSKETPLRIAKMLIDETFAGRFEQPPKITTFPNSKKMDQAIISGPIRIESFCSHHWQPFTGNAWIGYIPGDNVLGISKLSRVAKHYAKRPQIQEELTEQIADHLEEVLDNPKGIAVVIKSSHMCMTTRGVQEQHDCMMTTSSLRGAFKADPATRAEFMALVRQ